MRWSVTHTHVSIFQSQFSILIHSNSTIFKHLWPHLIVDLRPAAAGGAAQVDEVTVAVHMTQTPGEDRAHRDDGVGGGGGFFVFLLTFTLC